jgi:hypothetical protein
MFRCLVTTLQLKVDFKARAIIHRARELGFTLSEIRHLFFGFRVMLVASPLHSRNLSDYAANQPLSLGTLPIH